MKYSSDKKRIIIVKYLTGNTTFRALSEKYGIDYRRVHSMALTDYNGQQGLIYHSNRSIQYCSNEYTMLLYSARIKINMIKKGDSLENAIAERVNVILKLELLEINYSSFEEVQQAVKMAIHIYNH